MIRLLRPPGLLAMAVMATLVSGCGRVVPSGSTAPSVVASATATTRPTAATSSASPAGSPAGQTSTAWGRQWDDVPAAFPTYPGAARADDSATDEPVSAALVVSGATEAKAVATWYQHALMAAAFHAGDPSGPLENGGYVLDAVGREPACRVQVTVAPLGGFTSISVRYGAACPGR